MKISSKHKTIVVILMLILSVFLIALVLFFSREEGRTYTFEVGKPWLHKALEANFEFDIELDEATRKHISDSVEQNFAKIYMLDANKAAQQQALLERALAGRSGSRALLNAVALLYKNGIVRYYGLVPDNRRRSCLSG